jgi:hypothetical protein
MTREWRIAGVSRLDAAAWMRHASPWSVILRNTVLPSLIVAFWCRIWLGWRAAIPIADALLWTWVNPHLFPAPPSPDHRTSKSVPGGVWLNRDAVPVPGYHRRVPAILSAVGAIGLLFVAWGVLFFDPWPFLTGAVMVYMGKLWYLDRVVWLWQDMEHATGEYRSWTARV